MNTQTTPNPQEISTTSKTSMIQVLIAVLVSAVVFGFGGYYIGLQSSKNSQEMISQQYLPTPTQSPVILSDPTPTLNISDTTADWETYTGSQYSFKHPAGLKSDTGAAGIGAESIRFQFMGPKQIASGRTQTSIFDGYSFVVTKLNVSEEKTPIEWAAERRTSAIEICSSDIIMSEIIPISIDKGVGVQYTVKNCLGDYTSSYIAYGNTVYEINQLYTGDEADQKQYEAITNQIFNTLKFL